MKEKYINRKLAEINILPFVSIIWLLMIPWIVFAQYQGSVVQKERLIQTLRSKQFQTSDLVDVIRENGVDFKLTPESERELSAAGARPSLLEVVRNNYRAPVSIKPIAAKTRVAVKPVTKLPPDNIQPKDKYNLLLSQATDFYDNKKDRQGANDVLQEAVKLQPANPRAYQLLGFLNLYGFKNFEEAEKYWKLAIGYGGSAVLRVTHDHGGVFLTGCEGSLYISRNKVRYESDDNIHTLETSEANIKEIKVNSIFKRMVQLKAGSFKIVLYKDSDKAETTFSFAPLSGSTKESKMIIRLISKKN